MENNNEALYPFLPEHLRKPVAEMNEQELAEYTQWFLFITSSK